MRPKPANVYQLCLLACALAPGACRYDARLGHECPGRACPHVTPVAHDAAAGSEDAAVSDSATPQELAPLSVLILDAQGRSLERAELACDAECLQIEARAEGGEPPYSFRWSDGASESGRLLCPAAAQSYRVQVDDSVGSAGAAASLRVERAACADAGSPPTPTRRCETYSIALAACSSIANANGPPQLRANQRYSLRLHAASLSAPGTLEISGVVAGCVLSETLASLMLPAGPLDEQVCLRPTLDSMALQLVPLEGAGAELLTQSSASFEICESCD